MPWETSSTGFRYKLQFPYALHAKAAKLRHPQREELLDIWNELQKWFEAAQQLESKNISLEEENKRLKHENEFMLKIIDKTLGVGDE